MSPASQPVNRRFLAAASVALLSAIASAAPELPAGGRVEAGAATFTQGSQSLTIQQATQRVQIGWDSFNVGQGASVNFQQPSASALAVNLVRGGDASVIAGAINANGRVVLVNPQGIAFTGTAQVNVGSLVASALRDVTGDFSNGRVTLSGPGGEVSNAGTITVATGGHVVLSGSRVTNNGLILADSGKAALAAGSRVALDFAGDGLLKLSVESGAVDAAVTNGGAVRVGSGQVLMTAKAADGLADSVVRNSGFVSANAVVERGGEIWITADAVESTGSVSATSAQGQGGSAHLVGGKSVAVTGTVDVSGGAKGGFVDVSAPAVLLPSLFQIKVGRGGHFLLDPDNITVAGAGDPITGSPTTPAPGTDVTLHGADIEAWLDGGADLTLQTINAGTITVDKALTVVGTGNLTLITADGAININKAIDTAANLTLSAGGTGAITVDATIDAVDFSATTAGGAISTLHAINTSGAVTLTAGGDSALTIDGTINAASFAGTSAGGAVQVNKAITTSGALSLATTGFGALSVDAVLTSTAGNITAETQAGALQLNHNVNAAGAISLTSTTGGITTLATSALTGVGVSATSTGGDITLNAAADAGAGNLALSTTLGGTITAASTLDGVDISASTVDGNLTLNDVVTATGSIAFSATGTGAITTVGGATLAAATTLSVSTADGALTLNDTATAAGALSLSSTTGAITATSALTGVGVSATSTGGNIALNGAVNAGTGDISLATEDAGTINTVATATLEGRNISIELADGNLNVSGSVVASGAIDFSATGTGNITTFVGATLGADTTILVSATSGNIQLNDVATATGAITLESTTGDISAYSLLTASGIAVTSEGGDLDLDATDATTGNLALSTTLGGTITAASTLDGADISASTVNGNLILNDVVRATGLINLSATGTGAITTAAAAPLTAGTTLSVSTKTGDLTLGATADATAGAISLSSTTGAITANFALTGVGVSATSTGGNITLNAAADAGTGNLALSTTLGGAITAASTLDGVDISASTVDGDLTLDDVVTATGSLLLQTTAGDITLLGAVSASDAGIATTTGDLFLEDDVTTTVGDLTLSLGGDVWFNQDGIVVTSAGDLNLTLAGDPLTNIPQAAGGAQFTMFRNGTDLAVAGWLIAEDLAGPNSFALAGDVRMQYGFSSGFALPTAEDLTFVSDIDGFKNADLKAGETLVGYRGTDVFADAFTAPNLGFTWDVAGPTATSAVGSTFDYTATLGAGFTINKPGYLLVAMRDQGTLTVRTREILVKADDLAGEYGSFAKRAKYFYQITGFQNGDTLVSSGITGEALVDCDYDDAVPANRGARNYAIVVRRNTLTDPTDPNYELNIVNGNLAIAKAPLTVTADNATRHYGYADPAFTAAATGLKYTDTLADAYTGTLTFTPASDVLSDVGTYDLVLTGGAATFANYDPTFVNATLTITKAPLTLTMGDEVKVYGDAMPANPTLNYLIDPSGFRNGQNEVTLRGAGDLAGTVSYSTVATASSSVGTYLLNADATDLTAKNYSFAVLNPGTLTITKRTLTVDAAPTREYGLSNDAANITYNTVVTGWAAVNGDSQLTRLTGNPEIIGAPAITDNVGAYLVSIAQGTLDAGPNYDLSTPATTYVDPVTFTITKATGLVITADDKSRIYGDANPALTWTATGFRNADTAAVLTGDPLVNAPGVVATTAVGAYPINIARNTLDATNYDLSGPATTYVDGTLTINKATLQVAANSYVRKYGEANPAFGYVISGYKNSEDLGTSGVTGAPELTTLATQASAVGAYDIDITEDTLAADNYDFELIKGTLTINKNVLTVRANDASRTYGDLDAPGFNGFDVTGLQNGETLATSGITGVPVYGTNAVIDSPVAGNPYVVTLAQGTLDSTNYDLAASTYVNGVYTINKAEITVVASDKTRIYGDANPALEYTLEGFKRGETTLGGIAATGLPTLATAAAATTDVGTYDVTVDVAGMLAPNYFFTGQTGKITITKAPLTLKVDDATTEYGSDFAGFTLTMTGFKNGQTQADLRTAGTLSGDAVYTYTNAQVKLLNVNGSPYTVAATDIGDLDARNYSFSVQVPPLGTGQLTITKAPITLTATSITRTYGDASTQAQIDDRWDIVGLKNGQTRDGLLASGDVTGAAAVTSALALDATTNAGTYAGAVTATNGNFAVLVTGNYSFDIASVAGAADLIVDTAPVVVSVAGSPLTKVYGDDLPSLDPHYSGFKNGQVAADAGLIGAPVITTAATKASNVGNYAVIVDISGLSADNYTFTKVDGTLDITKAPLTVTADAKSRQYGLNNPTLTATITGYKLDQVFGASSSGVTGAPALATTATATSGIGVYPITAANGMLAATNYSFTFVDSTLTITRAPLTISADAKSKTYGDANPALTYSILGLRQADTAAVILGGLPTVSTTVDVLTGAGVYAGAITADITGLSAANYTIGTAAGTFTVNKATLVGTVDNASRYYGLPNPAFTVTWTGYKNGDTAATSGFAYALDFTTSAGIASPAAGSPYTVFGAPGTYSSPNYTFGAIAPGVLTIDSVTAVSGNTAELAESKPETETRREEARVRVGREPDFGDPRARINFTRYPFRLVPAAPGEEEKRKEDEAAKEAAKTVSKN